MVYDCQKALVNAEALLTLISFNEPLGLLLPFLLERQRYDKEKLIKRIQEEMQEIVIQKVASYLILQIVAYENVVVQTLCTTLVVHHHLRDFRIRKTNSLRI